MTEQDGKAVKQFLYSIRRTELAIINLEKALEELDTRRESPPDWMSRLDAVGGSGGGGGSKLESWTEFLDTYPARRSYLEDQLKQHRRKVEQYNQAVEMISKEPRWGALGKDIVRLKYYQHVRPDRAIYTLYLFCAERTFYEAHRRALKMVYDILPDRFRRRKAL